MRVELSTAGQHALSGAEIDGALVEMLEPRVLMAVGKKQEETFDLHAFAVDQQLLKAARRADVRRDFVNLTEPANHNLNWLARMVHR